MKITRKILEKLIKEELSLLIEQDGPMSGGGVSLAANPNREMLSRDLETSLSNLDQKLDLILARLDELGPA